jgi:hypothetical protein
LSLSVHRADRQIPEMTRVSAGARQVPIGLLREMGPDEIEDGHKRTSDGGWPDLIRKSKLIGCAGKFS